MFHCFFARPKCTEEREDSVLTRGIASSYELIMSFRTLQAKELGNKEINREIQSSRTEEFSRGQRENINLNSEAIVENHKWTRGDN